MKSIVKTEKGEVRGAFQDGIYRFHGIPYAKAPVGSLRFQMPEEAEPWDGVYAADCRSPIEPQRPSDLDIPMGPVLLPQNEDCLTLSVSTPSMEGALPVAVWMHGGANCYGGGDLEWYDGARLSEAGHVVVVNLNFRLGVFGFLCHPDINNRNLCIEDQMLALRWIQKNIRAFGGDPDRVTLFGQSAGANAIVHILSRPDSEGLFQQVILESPSLGRGNHTQADAFEVGRSVLANLELIPKEQKPLLEQIQEKTTEELLAAADRIDETLLRKHQGMVFKPVMDAWHTPEQTVHAAVQAAVQRNLRIVIGMTRDEVHAFVQARDEETLKQLSKVQCQRYDLPGHAFAKDTAKGGCRVWKYRFDWQAPESVFHACHCLELPFVFGNLDAWDALMLKGASEEELISLKHTIQKLWGGFFRFECPDESVWPPYTAGGRLVKCFDNMENPVMDEPYYGEFGAMK